MRVGDGRRRFCRYYAAKPHHFDVILMDIQMPILDFAENRRNASVETALTLLTLKC
jgi:CheY-like chemotaxis protein